MPVSSIFQQILPSYVMEDRIQAVLEEFMDDYLSEIHAQWGGDLLPKPRTWGIRPEINKWSEDAAPYGLVVSPGLEAAPSVTGDGWYSAPFRVGVVVFCSGKDEDSVRHNASIYGAAAAAILCNQRGSIDGCSDVQWDALHFTDGVAEQRRSLGAGTTEFVVHMSGLLNKNSGPTAPGQSGDWPLVEQTNLMVEQEA